MGTERERERERERETERETEREKRERERSDGWLLRGKRPVRAEEDGGEGEDDDDFVLRPNPCTCNATRRWLLRGPRVRSDSDEDEGRRRRGRERVLRRDSQVLERLEDERVRVLR